MEFIYISKKVPKTLHIKELFDFFHIHLEYVYVYLKGQDFKKHGWEGSSEPT